MAFIDFIPLLGGAIGGIASLFGSKHGADTSIEQQMLANQGNMELAQYAFDKNLEMWNMQNDYNTPYNQMSRLKEAGLNPNLMYGQGNTGNASSAPSYDAPTLGAYTSFGDFGASQAGRFLAQGLNEYYNVKKQNAEIDQMRQNTQNLETQNELTKVQILAKMYENEKSESLKDLWRPQLLSAIANLDSTTLLNSAKFDNTIEQTESTRLSNIQARLLLPYVQQEIELNLEGLLLRNGLTRAQIQTELSKPALNSALTSVAEMRSKILDLDLDTGKQTQGYNIRVAKYKAKMAKSAAKVQKILAEDGIKLGGNSVYNIGNALLKSITDSSSAWENSLN